MMEMYGYYYHPPVHPGEIGSPRLDIILRSLPSGEHFDPDVVTVPVINDRGDPQKLEVYHPWDYDLEYQLTAGRLLIADRHDKHFDAFIYGGQLSITTSQDKTICAIVSPAPILNLAPPLNAGDFLATETEILLAERRAYWEKEPEEFDHRLVAADPLELFHAVLESLRAKFKHFPPTENELLHQFVHYLNEESRTIHEFHKLTVLARPLEDIL
jgi:hypothetical protein